MAEKGTLMSSELSILQWYLDAGVDEVIVDVPWDRTAPVVSPVPDSPSFPVTPSALAARYTAIWADASPELSRPASSKPPATEVGRQAPSPADSPDVVAKLPAALLEELAAIGDLESLRARLDTFGGCALKATAMNTVFGVGPADADLMIIGEAPGEQEDRQGVPFVGPSGNLLNLMLNAIGLAREQVYFTNTIFWRPPGNRTPTPMEVQSCKLFLHRQISLVQPKVLLLVGGGAAKSLLQRTEGIMRLRGRWFDVVVAGATDPIPAIATLHPAYLLRSPAQKREAWQDLQLIRNRLNGEAI